MIESLKFQNGLKLGRSVLFVIAILVKIRRDYKFTNSTSSLV